ncbi:hypothetical protein EDB89DRAFT_2116204 [Lactarius sanguifluus]|nr:hypothetical protein EDB89DRAFT_2116204 [Lactarius sanguifluus]
MSFLRKFWQSISRPRYLIGKDLEGNRFYEYPSLSDDPLRTRRRVQYRVYEDMWHYIGGKRRLPVQWVSWLSHTRPDPPTLEELQADLERQRRVLYNAAVLQARDQDERARISAASAPSVTEDPPFLTPENIPMMQRDETSQSVGAPEPPPHSSHPIDRPRQAPRPSPDPELPPPVGKDRDWQPEAWTPQTTRRRGG